MKRCPRSVGKCGGNWIQRQLLRFGNGDGNIEPSLGYGLLYNWYAATDARGVAPSGFRVTTTTDWNDLQTSNQAEFLGQKTAIPEPYWTNLNAGSNNDTELTLYGAGLRESNGSYTSIRSEAVITTSTQIAPTAYDVWRISGASLTGGTNSVLKTTAGVIRCVSDTEPSTPLVQDKDGNNYSWVQIGSQYWLQQSLKTTTYNNGDAIPTGLDNAAWAATTDGAWAYPNGDSNLPI
jgi:uncharacterized protein (TIGR02145 family)